MIQQSIQQVRKSKYGTPVTDSLENGGVHNPRQLKKAQEFLLSEPFNSPALYHFTLTGAETIGVYQYVIKQIVRKLRRHGCLTEYFGAYEFDDVEGKSLHAHIFFMIETETRSPISILDVRDGQWLHRLTNKAGMNRVHLCKPSNAVHRSSFGKKQMYARPTLTRGRLADALEWASYPYKMRSKEGVPSREIYFNSEFTSNTAKRQAAAQPTLH